MPPRTSPRISRLSRHQTVGAWRSLAAHLAGGQGVGGSNPLAPTISEFSSACIQSLMPSRPWRAAIAPRAMASTRSIPAAPIVTQLPPRRFSASATATSEGSRVRAQRPASVVDEWTHSTAKRASHAGSRRRWGSLRALRIASAQPLASVRASEGRSAAPTHSATVSPEPRARRRHSCRRSWMKVSYLSLKFGHRGIKSA